MKLGPFRLGMRTLKTALAVMICIIIFKVFHRGTPMIAAIAAVFSLRQDLSTSLSFGKSRIIGNTLGGVLAILYFFIQNHFSHDFIVELIFIPILVIIVIVVSDGLNNNSGIISAIATLLLIALSIPQGETLSSAISRVIDTFIGTFVGIGVNFIMRPKLQEEKKEIEDDFMLLKKKEQELEALKLKIKQQEDRTKMNNSN